MKRREREEKEIIQTVARHLFSAFMFKIAELDGHVHAPEQNHALENLKEIITKENQMFEDFFNDAEVCTAQRIPDPL